MATTWSERLAELKAEGRLVQFGLSGRVTLPTQYPCFLGLVPVARLPAIVAAQAATRAPLRISEESYPDFPQHVALYLHHAIDLSVFWQAVQDETQRHGEEKNDATA